MNMKNLFTLSDFCIKEKWPIWATGFYFIVDILLLPITLIGLVAEKVLK